MNALDRRGARLALAGWTDFTADDLTNNGNFALDPNHDPNSINSGIGTWFTKMQRRGLIVFTGRVVQSKAPHRKGGAIRVWQFTEAALLWARNVLS